MCKPSTLPSTLMIASSVLKYRTDALNSITLEIVFKLRKYPSFLRCLDEKISSTIISESIILTSDRVTNIQLWIAVFSFVYRVALAAIGFASLRRCCSQLPHSTSTVHRSHLTFSFVKSLRTYPLNGVTACLRVPLHFHSSFNSQTWTRVSRMSNFVVVRLAAFGFNVAASDGRQARNVAGPDSSVDFVSARFRFSNPRSHLIENRDS